MYDRFNRDITYLRISVTDRCNLRCIYCMPEQGVPLIRHQDVLSFEEIRDVVRNAVEFGIEKVRLTGGEPLVRRGITDCVAMLAEVSGLRDFAMTTNGILLAQYAGALAEAGLHRVNISLDATESDRYAELTRGGDVKAVLKGIDAALEAGLTPVRLNCVVESGPEEKDARDVAQFASARQLEVRFIRRMHLLSGTFTKVIGGDGGDCRRCNRLRLMSDGHIRPCLFSDLAFNVREFGVKEALLRAIDVKPESGERCLAAMNRIGG